MLDQPDSHLREQKLDGELAYDGSFLRVQKDSITLPDGKVTTREYIRHPGAVVIVPLFDDGSVLLERQFRYPLDRVFIEFPAGKIDAGEDPLLCAQRELREETGYTASTWRHLCTIHNAIAYSDEHLEIYLARDLVAGPASLDDGEFLDTFTARPEEILAWVRNGQITDVKTIIGAFWLEKLVLGAW
ncbi:MULTISPECIES: NUDIX hydrolase [unclassified Undibacterium]|uniref:NUDIX hydrolase n=1 Tax=unclassified Undibacterium TaxID=2630295 RepID=UPI002AC977BC|nr:MULTISPECIES: NUDIX hydrolase [unclassified Undibacterium]MEB0139616.1 NUDIX hydrolase [Undibacterium sp. CCC2.1]MEB0171972.1 NUDIX hydrolase [Undibacterium sp. CCC1.1]MEB0176285.1 NUDIX hydrolase [Undibacterium sp. CCC3.4]MEB0213967.1 NUDIX hydrolase [Undibacterium sp. 5I2]WPX43583.1 NUDIX hydrolase [Undibacterium sp. CCC3.4]